MGIPATAKIESDEAALIKEHKEFKAYSKSEELARFEKLEKTVNTSEFASKAKNIKSQKLRDTEEYKKEKEYLSLKKTLNDLMHTKNKRNISA